MSLLQEVGTTMALFSPFSARSLCVFCLTLAAMLALSALAGCSSGSEPEPAAQDASVSPVIASPQSAPATPQASGQTIAPATVSPPPEAAPKPVLAPTATALVIVPSPDRQPVSPPEEKPSTPDSPGQVTPASMPETSQADTFHVPPGATWGDVYNSLSATEQSCILDKTGEERLALMRERPFGLEGMEQESVVLLDCVSDDTARELFLADMTAQMGGLSGEQESCIRTLLGQFRPSELAAASTAEPAPEDAMLLLSFGLGLVGCIPELAQEGGPPVPPEGAGPPSGGLQGDSLLWTFTTGGWVLTAPAVVDGVVYAGSDDRSLYALAADTGNLLWSHATGDVIRSTPNVADGRVFFGSNDNHVYALDAATGAELWKHNTGDWVQYTPAVSGGRVFFAAPAQGDRRVHAVDAATGQVAWVADHPFPIGAKHSPTPIGDRVYAQGAEYGKFYALDAATGQTLWQVEVGGYVESSPTALDGVVYLTVANRAYALDESTGEVIWEVNTEEFPARDFPALVVEGIYYLYPASNIYALDAATGEELWSYGAGAASTPLVVRENVLYGATGDGGSVFALDAATGQEIWREATGGQVIQSLTVTDGLLLGESDSGTLIAAARDSGIPVWSFEKGGFSDVRGYTVVDGVVYSAGPNNSIYAHREPRG